VATRHALSDLSLLKLCPVTPGALFLLLTPSARLLTKLWRRRFMSLDKGKQPQPISFFSSLPHIWLDEIFTIFGWLPHHFFVRMQCSLLLLGFMAGVLVFYFWQDRRPCCVQWQSSMDRPWYRQWSRALLRGTDGTGVLPF